MVATVLHCGFMRRSSSSSVFGAARFPSQRVRVPSTLAAVEKVLLSEPSYFGSTRISRASDPSSVLEVEPLVCDVRLAQPTT